MQGGLVFQITPPTESGRDFRAPSRLFQNRLRDCRAVGTGIGRAIVGSGFGIVHDSLAAAHLLGIRAADCDLVAALGELLQSARGDADFNRNIAAGLVSFGEARGFQRGLQIHAIVDQI